MSIAINFDIVQQDNIERLLKLKLTINEQIWSIASVYCPAEQKERAAFINSLPWKAWQQRETFIGRD